MRKLIPVAFVVFLCMLTGVCQSGSQSPAKDESKPTVPELKLSPEFKEAGATATDAISRIPDVKLPDDGYAARKLDAEKAIDTANSKVSTGDDKALLKVLQAWLALAVKQYQADPHRDLEGFKRAVIATTYCMSEATAVFKPKVLSDKGKQMAAEKRCLTEYQKIQEGAK